MSFVAPLFLVAAGMLAAGVVVLHYIVMRQPPQDVLPTARFVPMRPAVVRTMARRPEDLVLLLLRTMAILAVGTAFARPVFYPRRVAVAHVVIVDRSRAVADAREVADSARRLLSAPRDILVAFDSTPSTISTHTTDTLATFVRGTARGNISAALVLGLRAAVEAQARADSIEIVVVSPAAGEELDAATDSIRALWPGSMRLVRVAAFRDTAAAPRPTSVRWPDTARARAGVDTTSALVAAGAVVVAPFERRWVVDTAGGLVIARWVDGEPAAVERVVAGGCERRVVVPVAADGDLTLRPEFARFATLMHAACGAAAGLAPARGVWATDAGRPVRVVARPIARDAAGLMAWLIGAAIVLLLGELWVRRVRVRR